MEYTMSFNAEPNNGSGHEKRTAAEEGQALGSGTNGRAAKVSYIQDIRSGGHFNGQHEGDKCTGDGDGASSGSGTKSAEWLGRCMTNKGDRDGSPLPNLANIMLALRSDPAVQNLVAYDAMLCAPMLMHPVPVWGQDSGASEP